MQQASKARGPEQRLMRRCFDLARQAVAAGSHPFGALLARGGEVVMEARNTVAADGVTGHAELNLYWCQEKLS